MRDDDSKKSHHALAPVDAGAEPVAWGTGPLGALGVCVHSSADPARRGAVWLVAAAAVALCAGLALALPGLAQSPQTPRVPEPPVAIEIVAQRLNGFDHADANRRKFGALE